MKTIALIDFSLEGHHLAFVRTFSKILLDQGNKVICIVPDVIKVSSWIEECAADKKKNFQGYIYTFTPAKQQGFGKFNEAVSTLKRWRYDAALLKQIEKQNKIRIDLAFYAWIDSHLSQYIHSALLKLVFPFKWSGLYFHPYHLRFEETFLKRKGSWRDHDSIFQSDNCVAVAVHDLGIVKDFTKRIGKPVIHFPETADDTVPDLQLPLYREIKDKAKGRIVVGMIGCEKHKGTLTMMRMAKMADASQFYFAFLGILPEATYSGTEWLEVQSFIQSQPENCFFHFHSIPEGAAYNAVFCAIDIPFLVYDNFISSSNRLTKAAIFEKLVLSSNNYCVGGDVKQFNLGEAVPPQNPMAALEGLKLLATKIRDAQFPREQWEIYKEINSEQKLYERFKEIITLLNK